VALLRGAGLGRVVKRWGWLWSVPTGRLRLSWHLPVGSAVLRKKVKMSNRRCACFVASEAATTFPRILHVDLLQADIRALVVL